MDYRDPRHSPAPASLDITREGEGSGGERDPHLAAEEEEEEEERFTARRPASGGRAGGRASSRLPPAARLNPHTPHSPDRRHELSLGTLRLSLALAPTR